MKQYYQIIIAYPHDTGIKFILIPVDYLERNVALHILMKECHGKFPEFLTSQYPNHLSEKNLPPGFITLSGNGCIYYPKDADIIGTYWYQIC